jgi:hypothetical protein
MIGSVGFAGFGPLAAVVATLGGGLALIPIGVGRVRS